MKSQGIGWEDVRYQDEVKLGTLPLQNVARRGRPPVLASQSKNRSQTVASRDGGASSLGIRLPYNNNTYSKYL